MCVLRAQGQHTHDPTPFLAPLCPSRGTGAYWFLLAGSTHAEWDHARGLCGRYCFVCELSSPEAALPGLSGAFFEP